jgi:hypothetical protein
MAAEEGNESSDFFGVVLRGLRPTMLTHLLRRAARDPLGYVTALLARKMSSSYYSRKYSWAPSHRTTPFSRYWAGVVLSFIFVNSAILAVPTWLGFYLGSFRAVQLRNSRDLRSVIITEFKGDWSKMGNYTKRCTSRTIVNSVLKTGGKGRPVNALLYCTSPSVGVEWVHLNESILDDRYRLSLTSSGPNCRKIFRGVLGVEQLVRAAACGYLSGPEKAIGGFVITANPSLSEDGEDVRMPVVISQVGMGFGAALASIEKSFKNDSGVRRGYLSDSLEERLLYSIGQFVAGSAEVRSGKAAKEEISLRPGNEIGKEFGGLSVGSSRDKFSIGLYCVCQFSLAFIVLVGSLSLRAAGVLGASTKFESVAMRSARETGCCSSLTSGELKREWASINAPRGILDYSDVVETGALTVAQDQRRQALVTSDRIDAVAENETGFRLCADPEQPVHYCNAIVTDSNVHRLRAINRITSAMRHEGGGSGAAYSDGHTIPRKSE